MSSKGKVLSIKLSNRVLTWFDIPDRVKLLPDPAVLQPLFVTDGIDAWRSEKAKFQLLIIFNFDPSKVRNEMLRYFVAF